MRCLLPPMQRPLHRWQRARIGQGGAGGTPGPFSLQWLLLADSLLRFVELSARDRKMEVFARINMHRLLTAAKGFPTTLFGACLTLALFPRERLKQPPSPQVSGLQHKEMFVCWNQRKVQSPLSIFIRSLSLSPFSFSHCLLSSQNEDLTLNPCRLESGSLALPARGVEGEEDLKKVHCEPLGT